METILILIAIFVCLFILKSRIDKVGDSLKEVKDELKRIKASESVKERMDEPLAGKHTSPVSETVRPVPDIVDEVKEKAEEFPPIPEVASTPQKIKERELPPPPPPVFIPAPRIETRTQTYRPAAVKERKRVNYEKYIGENLFGKIGILILVIGVGFFVKYAIDKNWINEVMRTALGFAIGVALLLVAQRLKKKYRAFSSLLSGGSFAIFYITVAIAYHYYQLFNQPVAFALLILITILMSVLSLLYNHRELAIIALVGGFIAPFLVSTGEGNYMVLFTYLIILNLGMFFLSLFKKWSELTVIGFVFTSVIMLLYVLQNYYIDIYVPQPGIYSTVPIRLLVFSTLFYFIFLLPLIIIIRSETQNRNNQVLLLLIGINNFVYLAFGLFFLSRVRLSFDIDGLLPLFISIVNAIILVGLYKNRNENKLLSNTLLGMVIVFATIAIPIQFSNQLITIIWSAEMILLAWLYIKSKFRLYEYATFAVMLLALFSFLIDIVDYNSLESTQYLISHLFLGISVSVLALMISRYRKTFEEGVILKYNPWNTTLIVFAVIIFYYALSREIYTEVAGFVKWIKTQIAFSTGYLLLLTVLFKKRYPINTHTAFYATVLSLNVLMLATDSYLVTIDPKAGAYKIILSWLIALLTILSFGEIGRQYYGKVKPFVQSQSFTVYFTVLAVITWLSLENLLLNQLGLTDEKSAGFSIALSLAGFILMALGMKLHLKVFRKLSLITLGIVLAKLVIIDLWAMPTVGKIIVFIFLGITLLLLSFLYQKLKNVLFGEEDDKTKN